MQGLEHSREQPDHRRLAGGVRADEPEHLALRHGEAQIADLEGPPAVRAHRVGESDVTELAQRRHSVARPARERRSQMKKGAPQKDVSTPTESSAGATTVRASVSAASRKAPPASRAAGTRSRLSGPSSIRSACGTMRPTKPMGPTKATAVPVRSAAPAKM